MTAPGGVPVPGSAVLVRMDTVQPKRITWLWRGRIAAGKVHLIDGDPGLGKSMMTIDLIARYTAGAAWPDGQPADDSGGAVIMTAEDALDDTVRPRLDLAGAKSSRVVAITGVYVHDPDTHDVAQRMPSIADLDPLRDAIRSVDAGIVVIDPLSAYLPDRVDAYRDSDIRRAMAPLAAVAQETGAAIILVRHLNKKSPLGSAVYAGGGSIGIIGAARIGYVVGRDPDDPDHAIMACSKINIGPMPDTMAWRIIELPGHDCARIEWDTDPVEITADEIVARAANTASNGGVSKRKAVIQKARDILIMGPMRSTEFVARLSETCGASEETITRARKEAGIEAWSRGKDPREWWVSLPGVPHEPPETP